jgi:plastocyanin
MLRRFGGVVVLLAVLAAAGCGSSSSSSTGGPTGLSDTAAAGPGTPKATVIIKDNTFTPANLVVARGTLVTWINKDSVPHTVTLANGPGVDAQPVNQGVNSGQIAPGKSFNWLVVKQGTFFYMCTLHPTVATMHAKITAGQAP